MVNNLIMKEEIFWDLIEKSSYEAKDDMDKQYSQLFAELEKLPKEDIIAYKNIFDELYVKSYTSELWGAAYVINGGCSDDGFDYFRAWLISKGKEAYYNALKNPDSLADVLDENDFDEAEFEELLYIAQEVYGKKTDENDFDEKIKSIKYPSIALEWSEDEDILDTMFPRLAELLND